MIFNDLLTHTLVLLYIIASLSGLYAIRTSMVCKTKFTGVWLSTIACIAFTMLHAEYNSVEIFSHNGIERDRIWGITHIIAAIAIIWLHLSLIKKFKALHNEQ